MVSMQGFKNTKGELFSIDSFGSMGDHTLTFMFNPSSISESRSVNYNFSEGQGQTLPFAQFGMINNTTISFELFMFHHGGLKEEIASLRRLTLPKSMSRRTFYDQVQPHKYWLLLHEYGTFEGVVNSLEITVDEYSRLSLIPIKLTAKIEFTVISSGLAKDVTHIKQMGKY